MSWSFDGDDEIAATANLPAYPTSVSAALWFKAPSDSVEHPLLSWYQSDDFAPYVALAVTSAGKGNAYLADGSSFTKSAISSASITANAWQHLALTFDGSAGSNPVLGYLNGVSFQVTGDTFTNWPSGQSPQRFKFGSNYNNSIYYTGLIAYPAVWDVVLSGGDITSLQSALPSSVQSGNLQRYWEPDSYVDVQGSGMTFSETYGNVTNSGDNPTLGGGGGASSTRRLGGIRHGRPGGVPGVNVFKRAFEYSRNRRIFLPSLRLEPAA